MNNWVKNLLFAVLICAFCLKANGQVLFKIDSLAFSCYDKSKVNFSWEREELAYRGPDVFVFGRLVNVGNSPILLELYEDAGDSLIVCKELLLYVSYQEDKNSYYFPHDPLIVTDIMSYPYLAGRGLPTTTVDIDGKHMLLSVIRVGESIPLSFETLSKPKTEKKSNRYSQEKVIKAIRATLEIKPSVQEHIVVLDEDRLFREILLESQEKDCPQSEYDVEMSVPTSFLDTKPRFSEGDTLGFYRWLQGQLLAYQPQFLGEERRFLVMFVVGKDGKIVYVKATNSKTEEFEEGKEELIKEVLFKSPQWIPGELHGTNVDSRISLSLSFDAEGEIMDLFLL